MACLVLACGEGRQVVAVWAKSGAVVFGQSVSEGAAAAAVCQVGASGGQPRVAVEGACGCSQFEAPGGGVIGGFVEFNLVGQGKGAPGDECRGDEAFGACIAQLGCPGGG